MHHDSRGCAWKTSQQRCRVVREQTGRPTSTQRRSQPTQHVHHALGRRRCWHRLLLLRCSCTHLLESTRIPSQKFKQEAQTNIGGFGREQKVQDHGLVERYLPRKVREGRRHQGGMPRAEGQQQLAQEGVILHEQVHCASEEVRVVLGRGAGSGTRTFGRRWIVKNIADMFRCFA